jgi:hypothetical protein
MRKFYDKLSEWLPYLWGLLWMVIITVGSVAALVWVVQWLVNLVTGVIVC